jgi:hypothetical protein
MWLGACPAQDAERSAIDALVRVLEAHTPVEAPTAALEALSGDWRLLYTTASSRFAFAHLLPVAVRCSRRGLRR